MEACKPRLQAFKAQQFSSLPLFNLSSWSPNSINWPLLTTVLVLHLLGGPNKQLSP